LFGGEEGTYGSALEGGLELAANNREGRSLTSHVDVEPLLRVMYDAKQAVGGSQSEERNGLAAAAVMICRRRKIPV
jgi:hypothetical protein